MALCWHRGPGACGCDHFPVLCSSPGIVTWLGGRSTILTQQSIYHPRWKKVNRKVIMVSNTLNRPWAPSSSSPINWTAQMGLVVVADLPSFRHKSGSLILRSAKRIKKSSVPIRPSTICCSHMSVKQTTSSSKKKAQVVSKSSKKAGTMGECNMPLSGSQTPVQHWQSLFSLLG